MFIYIPFKIPYLWCQIYNTGVYGRQLVMPYFKSTYWGMLRTTTVRVRENNHRQIYLFMYACAYCSKPPQKNKLRTIPHTVRFIHSILQTEWSPFIWTRIDGWTQREGIVLLVCMRMLEGVIPQWFVILCWGYTLSPLNNILPDRDVVVCKETIILPGSESAITLKNGRLYIYIYIYIYIYTNLSSNIPLSILPYISHSVLLVV